MRLELLDLLAQGPRGVDDLAADVETFWQRITIRSPATAWRAWGTTCAGSLSGTVCTPSLLDGATSALRIPTPSTAPSCCAA